MLDEHIRTLNEKTEYVTLSKNSITASRLNDAFKFVQLATAYEIIVSFQSLNYWRP